MFGRLVAVCVALTWSGCEGGTVFSLDSSREAVIGSAQVGWTALFDNGNNGSRPLWTINEAKTKKAPWIDMAVEVMNFKWNQVMDDTGKVVTDKVESTLTELAKRGLQGILTVSFHNGWSEGANKGYMPKYLFDMGNVTCKDFEGKIVGAYGREEMIAAIEKTAAGLGEVFNGDKRLFATEVGFVGHAGLWQQGVEENPDVTCPLPDQAATRRIITAVANAFKDTFVLMPRPWVAKEFPFANYPNMGLIDPNFFGEHTQLELAKLGLEDRWKTAPVLARLNEALDKGGCWFDGYAAGSCQSAAKELPPFADALATVHPTSLQVNRLFYDNANNVPLLEEAKEAYMQTGAQLHLSGVALETYADTTMICASVTNIGSAPFYAPANAPLTLQAKVGAVGNPVEVAPAAAGKTLSTVLPNETAVFAVTVDFAPKTDECVQYASVCTAEGQTCEDANTSPHSRGDWSCVCPGTNYKELGKPAVCGYETVFQQDAVTWYDRTTPEQVVGNASSFGWIDSSFSVSMRVKVSVCPTDGCDDGKTDVAYVWSQFTTLGYQQIAPPTATIKGKVRMGAEFFYNGQDYRMNFQSFKQCAAPGNGKVTTKTVGNWNHVTYSYSKPLQTVSMYINGELTTSCDAFEPLRRGDMLTLGRAYGKLDKALVGWLSEVRFMKGAVTAKEAALLSATPTSPREPMVTAHLWMDTQFRQRQVRFATQNAGINPDTGVFVTQVPVISFLEKAGEEACKRWQEPPAPEPTPVPDPFDPTVKSVKELFEGCATLRVNDSSRGGMTEVDVTGCTGDFVFVDAVEGWRHDGVPGRFGPRSLHPIDNNTRVACTLGGAGPDGAQLYAFTSGQFAALSRCVADAAPTPQPPPTPAPPTDAPATPAPPGATETPPGIDSTLSPQRLYTPAPPGETPEPFAQGGEPNETAIPGLADRVVHGTGSPYGPSGRWTPGGGYVVTDPTANPASNELRGGAFQESESGYRLTDPLFLVFLILASLCFVMAAAVWLLYKKRQGLEARAQASKTRWSELSYYHETAAQGVSASAVEMQPSTDGVPTPNGSQGGLATSLLHPRGSGSTTSASALSPAASPVSLLSGAPAWQPASLQGMDPLAPASPASLSPSHSLLKPVQARPSATSSLLGGSARPAGSLVSSEEDIMIL